MASAKSTITLPDPSVALYKVINRYFDELENDLPQEIASPYSVADAVHTIAADTDISAGNFTITVTLKNGETFTTANIAFDDDAATIESAIDTAATSASITGWTNGDISVSGGSIDTADVVLTFDGESVEGTNHPLTSVTDVDLVDGTVDVVTETTVGHPAAPVTQLLATQGWVSVDDLADPDGWTRNTLIPLPQRCVVEFQALQVAAELQDDAFYTKIMALGNFDRPAQQRSPISAAL